MSSSLTIDDKPVIITVASELKPYEPASETYTLEELQAAVGGYIQLITLANNYRMVIDEEGKIKSKPINLQATLLAHECGAIFPNDVINGDALVCRDELID